MKLQPYLLIVLLVLPALCGCKVGPNYQRPEMDVPSAWQGVKDGAEEKGQFESSAATPEQGEAAQWWRLFKDPVLDSLIERAVQSNLDLRLAEARICEARALRGVSKAALWPTIDNMDSYTRLHISGNAGELGALGPLAAATGGAAPAAVRQSAGVALQQPDSFNLFQAAFDSSWELDFFGGTRRNIEAASADLDAAHENRRDVLVTLLAEVARNYAGLRGLQRQIQIAQENLKAQQKTLELTRTRFHSNVATGLDVARAEALVAGTESGIPTLETNAARVIHRLGLLLGQEPGLLLEELSQEAPIPLPSQPIAVGVPADLLTRRPDIRRAERQLAAATARIGVATADLFPKLSLTNSAGWESLELKDLLHSGGKLWSLGPGMTIPLFHGGAIKQNIRIQNARQEEAWLVYRAAVLAALQEVEDSLTAYANEGKRNELLKKAVAANKIAQDLAFQLYTGGVGEFLDVLDAQRSLYASQAALAQSEQLLAENVIALYKALGGGWEETTGNKVK